MTISFACPHCGRQIRVSDGAAGQSGKCTECGGRVSVPASGRQLEAGFAPIHREQIVQRVDVSPNAMRAGFAGAFGAFFGRIAAIFVCCLLLGGCCVGFGLIGSFFKPSVDSTPIVPQPAPWDFGAAPRQPVAAQAAPPGNAELPKWFMAPAILLRDDVSAVWRFEKGDYCRFAFVVAKPDRSLIRTFCDPAIGLPLPLRPRMAAPRLQRKAACLPEVQEPELGPAEEV